MFRELALVLAVAQAAAPPAAPTAPAPREIAAGTFLLPGAILPDRGPDGNTVVLTAPQGLIVVDTGRHAWHSDGILAFAKAQQRPIVAIVNTHWHLDHSSGNVRLKAVYPEAKVYTTKAVDAAIAPGGFLARNFEAAKAKPPADTAPALQREERQIFLTTMETAQSLKADVPVERTGALKLAGRTLSVRVTDGAVSAADVWIYDEATRAAILGDLVTLPAPFFETACPATWEAALDEVWATGFTQAIPGHGPPMSRAQFDAYRQAFAAFRTCVGGATAAAECATGWTRGVAEFLAGDADRKQAAQYATYYVDFLRKNGGASPDCAVK
jgi:glyoxylase-like metal-dependent hydrolase (beta-lactamase superfamily II)